MQKSRVTWVIATAFAVLSLAAVAGCQEIAVTTSTGASPGSTANPLIPTTAPVTPTTVSETPTTVSAITPGAVVGLVTPEGLFTAGSQIQVLDQGTFGDWAASYVWAEGQNVYLVIFRSQGSGWVIVDAITGLDWVDTQARLRSRGAPEDLIAWSNPEGD